MDIIDRNSWATALALVAALGCGGAQQPAQSNSGNPDAMLADEPPRQVPQASRLVQQGESKLAGGDAAGARALFEQAIAEQPEDARAHLDLGLAHESLGDVQAAEQAYRRAAEIDATLAEAHNNLGALLRDKGDTEGAMTALRAALRANPRSASAHANLAMTLEDAGQAEEAVNEYRQALQAEAGNVMVRVNLGLLLVALERADEAKRELRQAAQSAQDNRPALVAIGNGLRRVGDAGGAVEAMRAAIAAGDGQPTPALLAELALAELAAGSRDTAIATLERALSLDGRFAVGHYLVANMYAAAGNKPQAAQHYKKYLQLDPQGPHAAQAQERLTLVEPGAPARGRR